MTEDPRLEPVQVGEAGFRRVVGRFATGVTVVTTRTGGAAPMDHGITVSSFTSVSLEPLLVLICVEKVARFHPVVAEAGVWAVSVLGEDAAEASRWFATRGRPLEGQFGAFGHHPGPVTGCAVLDQALASLECRTVAAYDGGDHTILLGEVVGLADAEGGAPLLYYEGGYRSLG